VKRMKETLKQIGFGILLGLFFSLMWITDGFSMDTNRYLTIMQEASERDCKDLEQVVYWESVRAKAPFETSMAVVEVIYNRILDESGCFPNTISKVIRQKHQFATVKFFYTCEIPWLEFEEVCDAICEVTDNGRTVLPYDDYVYFDIVPWKWGKDWIWVGDVDSNGKPIPGKGMYFGRKK